MNKWYPIILHFSAFKHNVGLDIRLQMEEEEFPITYPFYNELYRLLKTDIYDPLWRNIKP